MDFSVRSVSTARQQQQSQHKGSHRVSQSSLFTTPDAPRAGAKPSGDKAQCRKQQVGVISESQLKEVQTTIKIQPRSRMQHPRPQGVPALDLGRLADKDDKLHNPIVYEEKLDPPDTASTVSWGYHDYTPAAGRSSALNAPFALHHTPGSAAAAGRNQLRSQRAASPLQKGTKKSKPKSAWDDPVVPENLPPPSERQKQQFKQHENDIKHQYQKHSQRGAQQQQQQPAKDTKQKALIVTDTTEDEDSLSNSWRNPYSPQQQAMKTDAEKELAERKKQALLETVMVDQLSRAVISDPEQDQALPSSNRGTGLFATSRPRNLHHSKVKTSGTATEKLLSKRISFSGRVLTRNGPDALRELCGFYFALDNTMTIYEYRQFGRKSSALPFIQRGSYSHVGGRRKGRSYVVQDLAVGRDLTFETNQQVTLPAFLKKSPIVSIRVTDVDDSAKEEIVFQGNVPYNHEEYQRRMAPPISKQEHEDIKLLAQIQGKIHTQLKKRAAKTLIGLGRHFRQLDQSGDGVLSKAELKQALNTYHINIDQQLFDKLWDVVDQNGDGAIDYAEFRRAFIGEMNEYRKGYVRKVFQKVDSNKSGTISRDELTKFYCVQKHPKVVQGLRTAAEVLDEFLQLFDTGGKEISFGEFDDYFEGVSIMTSHDDDYVNMMKSCWGL